MEPAGIRFWEFYSFLRAASISHPELEWRAFRRSIFQKHAGIFRRLPSSVRFFHHQRKGFSFKLARTRVSSVAQVNQLVSQINLDNWLLRVYPSQQVRMHWVGFSSGLSFPRYSSIANVAIGPALTGASAPIPNLFLKNDMARK